MGMINLGVQLGVTGIFTYVVDCHREQAGEAFAALNVSLPTTLKRVSGLTRMTVYQEHLHLWPHILCQQLDRYTGDP